MRNMLEVSRPLRPLSFLVFIACILILLAFLDFTDVPRGTQNGETISKSNNKMPMDSSQNANPNLLLLRLKEEKDFEINRLLKELEEARNHINEKSQIVTRLTGETGLHKKTITEKENELAELKADFGDQLGILQLHLAITRGDEEGVKELIQSGADVNARYNDSETPIMVAATSMVDANATLQITKYLIEHGADVLAMDNEGQTFLHKFALAETPLTPLQFHELADYLVSKDVSSLFNIQEKSHRITPLMLAARNIELEMDTISLLQENGVNVTLVDDNGSSYLSYAAEGSKNLRLLTELNAKGEINHKTLVGAIKYMDGDSVKVVVRLGADKDGMGTALQLAAESENTAFAINILKFLIKSGADVEAGSVFQKTFLHTLLRRPNNISPAQFRDMATFLISRNLTRLFSDDRYCTEFSEDDGVRHMDSVLVTPFQLAVRNVEVDTATLSFLKNNGVNMNELDSWERSVLFHATLGNQTLRLISDLVDLGAKPKQLTDQGESMLHPAALNGNVELLKFFLDEGLDINGSTKYGGDTPLHFALKWRSSSNGNVFKTVQFLLKNGARSDIANDKAVSIISSTHTTPLEYFNAYRDKYPEALRKLSPIPDF